MYSYRELVELIGNWLHLIRDLGVDIRERILRLEW